MTGADRGRRVAAVAAVAVVAFAAGSLVGFDAEAPARSTATVATPSASASASAGAVTGGRIEIPPEAEPYDYRPAPALEASPLDGFYLRIFTLEQMGGPVLGVPFHCLRCVPYSVDAGVQTLLLHEGRFYLEHQLNGFRALGHFAVEGDRVVFFNDPNCSRTKGRYTWDLERRRLTLEVVDDPCPYVDERSNDLTLASWTRVDVCFSGIEHWYPVRVGCTGQ